MKQDIRDLTPKELRQAIEGLSFPRYRAAQILRWLYKKNTVSFDEMKDIPAPARDALARSYSIGAVTARERLVSKDGAEKLLYGLGDGGLIESVFIPARDRGTVCVSTQVGCKYACGFCASGKKGFTRDLTPSEILSQILYLRHDLGHRITNVVFMGMGEPLDNLENVEKAIVVINSPEGMNIASRRITVSTCGIIPGIERLAGLGLQVNLSISLHAADDALRSRLMPVNNKYPLDKLAEAALGYFKKTKRKIFLDYIVLEGVNDSEKDAAGLAAIAKKLKAAVNLIEYHNFPGAKPLSPPEAGIRGFMARLESKKVTVTLRQSRGIDIQAGCGQLCKK